MLSKRVYESGARAATYTPEAVMRSVCVPIVLALLSPATAAADSLRLPLASGWSIQSSAAVAASGDAISRPGFVAAGWHPASVPGTVVGALVEELPATSVVTTSSWYVPSGNDPPLVFHVTWYGGAPASVDPSGANAPAVPARIRN
jgi:hypothetical protein